MHKKIVILMGSPRKNGNTARLVESFARGAQNAGHTVKIFALHEMHINPCTGCLCGGKDAAHPCTLRDDMDLIYPHYIAADVVVLASPLYYWLMSAQLKCAIDRLFAVAECTPGYRNPQKQSVLLMAAEGKKFEEIDDWYSRLMRHLNWEDCGRILAGGVLRAGEIDGREELQQAYLLGASLT